MLRLVKNHEALKITYKKEFRPQTSIYDIASEQVVTLRVNVKLVRLTNARNATL